MRGKHRIVEKNTRHHRIIPAHAGQTQEQRNQANATMDHPRACGANRVPLALSSCRIGSSPRMRGKLHDTIDHDTRPRIIPAHAGQTVGSPSWTAWRPDHPRACGANSSGGRTCPTVLGSSPRMRGKRLRRVGCGDCRRIIPAHAGQTNGRSRRRRRTSDHPRACGANIDVSNWQAGIDGSSPRMRGKQRDAFHVVAGFGIIPAHAGQTPISRGVSDMDFGSSPRMRGKQSDSISKTHSDNTRKIRFAQSVTFR